MLIIGLLHKLASDKGVMSSNEQKYFDGIERRYNLFSKRLPVLEHIFRSLFRIILDSRKQLSNTKQSRDQFMSTHQNTKDLPAIPRRMITIGRVCAIAGIRPSTVYDKIKKGQFPPGKKYSAGRGGARRWDEAEILRWLDEASV